MRISLHQLLISVLTLTLGCSPSPGPGPGAVDGGALLDGGNEANVTTVSQSVGVDGGSLSHASGASLTIPAGALYGAAEISMQGASAPSLAAPDEAVGQAFVLGPDGKTFNQPVELALPLDPARLPSGVDASRIYVLIAPNGSTEYSRLETRVDLSLSKVFAKTTHFSKVFPALLGAGSQYLNNPVPNLTGVGPTEIAVGSADTEIGVYGTNFVPTSKVVVAGNEVPTLFLADTWLKATIPASMLSSTTTLTVKVVNPPPVGGESVTKVIGVSPPNPVPVMTSLSPSSVAKGSGDLTVTVSGSNFVPKTFAGYPVGNGDEASLPTTFVSATVVKVLFDAQMLSAANTVSFSLHNPPPGGGGSNSLTFTVTP